MLIRVEADPPFFPLIPPVLSSDGRVRGWTVSVQQQEVHPHHLEVRR